MKSKGSSSTFARQVAAVVHYEIKRMRRKKALYATAFLAVGPPLLFLALSKTVFSGVQLFYRETLWAQLLGVQTSLASAISLGSISWIIGAIFGGDLFASELEDRSFEMLLVRPASRTHIYLGKVIGLLMVLTGMYVLAFLVDVGVNLAFTDKILNLEYAPLAVSMLILATFGFAMLASLIGVLLKRSTLAMILTIGIYYALSIGATLVVIFFLWGGAPPHANPQGFIRDIFVYQSYIPTQALTLLPSVTYTIVSGAPHAVAGLPLPTGGEEIIEGMREAYPVTVTVATLSLVAFTLTSYLSYRRVEA